MIREVLRIAEKEDIQIHELPDNNSEIYSKCEIRHNWCPKDTHFLMKEDRILTIGSCDYVVSFLLRLF